MSRSLRLLVGSLFVLWAIAGSGVAGAASSDLFFSEYIEGSSNNKALEIYNGTGAPIDLAAGAYNVQMYSNGSTTASLTINLVGTVASGDVFVLAHGSAAAAILAQADQLNSGGWYNGNDAVLLRKGTTVIDSIGQVGFNPGVEWGTGLTSTADNTLRRKAGISAGDTVPGDAFDPAVEWDGYATRHLRRARLPQHHRRARPGHRSVRHGHESRKRCDRRAHERDRLGRLQRAGDGRRSVVHADLWNERLAHRDGERRPVQLHADAHDPVRER